MSGAAAEVGSTANHYQILARLAVGGMAEIFLARGASAAGVERYCVLKRILRNRASDLHFVRMFLDEARLAAQLNHPNVAQVYDIGKLADSYFFTMEYVHGETVRAVLQRARSLRRELPLGAILTVIAGAAAGLHHAHDRLGLDGRPLGIVHRDVSPSNLMVSYEGGVKVVDFGVAKAADRMSETRSGTVKGKISYLSPEQCRGAEVDRRTDLFALGIVMWEMLTGERLYRRASDFENMSAIVNEPPPRPSSRRPALPPELDALVMRLLAKRADDRYQTAADVIDAIEQVSAATGTMISPSGLGRLLREMFGQRPEPWLEVDPLEAAEGVTVTSEPLPSELADSPAEALDAQLADVPDLSAQRELEQDDAAPPPVTAAGPRHRPTAPLRVGRSKGAESSASESAPPLPPPPSDLTDLAMAATQPGELPLPAPPVTLPGLPANRTGPGPLPGAPAQAAQDAGGEARRSEPGLPPPVAVPALAERAAPPARRWPMIAVILAAMAIGSLTVLLVMTTGGGGPAPGSAHPSPPPRAAATGPSVTPIVEPSTPADAAPAAATAEIDAAPAAPVGPPKTPLERAMDEARHADAVALCGQAPAPDVAATCTLAACRARLEGKARAWLPRAPAGERPRLIGQCRGLGIDPSPPRRPPPPRPDAGIDPCEANPMACQH